MKEWKFEYMNESEIAEIDKLWKDGHADALMAYGLECGNAGAKGYASRLAKGALLSVAEAVIVAGVLYFGKKAINKLCEKKKSEENDFVEVMDDDC